MTGHLQKDLGKSHYFGTCFPPQSVTCYISVLLQMTPCVLFLSICLYDMLSLSLGLHLSLGEDGMCIGLVLFQWSALELCVVESMSAGSVCRVILHKRPDRLIANDRKPPSQWAPIMLMRKCFLLGFTGCNAIPVVC